MFGVLPRLSCKLKFGECCALDKKIKVKFRTILHCMRGPLNCVHIDVWSPIKTASLRGHRHFVSFVHYLSKSCWVYTMRQKFEVLKFFIEEVDGETDL